METENQTVQPQPVAGFTVAGLGKAMLKGAGQVMFQGSMWTGLFFIAGIFWGAYETGTGIVAWGALLGLLVSTVTGYVLRLPRENGAQGLWGFNGILVGCAFPTFLGNTVFMWVSLILCAMLCTWVRTGLNNVMAPWKVNSFTFPFVFTTWIFLLAARMMGAVPPEYLSAPVLTTTLDPTLPMAFGDLIIYWLKGIAQVFLINSWVTGIFFLVGLYLSNKWAAIWAAIASAVALFVILVLRGPGSDIANGLFGFSPVLTGIALGMTFYKVNIRTAIWALIGVIVTVYIQAGMDAFMHPFGIPTLTGPFCLATWLFLLPLFKFKEIEIDHSNWDKKKN